MEALIFATRSVASVRRPDWCRDEISPCCDLSASHIFAKAWRDIIPPDVCAMWNWMEFVSTSDHNKWWNCAKKTCAANNWPQFYHCNQSALQNSAFHILKPVLIESLCCLEDILVFVKLAIYPPPVKLLKRAGKLWNLGENIPTITLVFCYQHI